MGKSYRPDYPDEELLLPPSLREWLPENHLAYFVSDVVDHLDLSAIEAVYGAEKPGQPPYDPRMMTKLLVYAYCVGVFSSRRIQRRLAEDIAFKVLAAGNEPNFRTISDFRKIHLKGLEGLFEQVLKIALEAGAMKLGRVALDGTKMKANASKHKAMSYDWMKDKEQQFRDEVKQLLEQAEAADAAEDAQYGRNRRGDELPEELQRRESRLKKIKEAKRVVEARAREKAAGAANDKQQLMPVIEAIEEQSGQRPTEVLADSGYCSEQNLEKLDSEEDPERRIGGYVATERQKHNEYKEPCPRGPLPQGATRVDHMKRKLKTKAGKAVYAARKAIVEPVFGQIKHARGFRQFLLRGIDKVRGEWSLICMTHNILKMHRLCNA
jgi:transposase